MSEVSDYTITVKTGNRKFAGIYAYVIIHDESGKKSKPVVLNKCFRNYFIRGKDIFQLNDLPYFSNFSKLELWRDNLRFGDPWYVDTIKLHCLKSGKTYVFPIYRWIKADYHYMFSNLNTSLPQDDRFQEQRRMEIEEKRKLFDLEQKTPGLPMEVKVLPGDESFSSGYWLSIFAKQEFILTVKRDFMLCTSGRWEKLEHISNVYRRGIFTEPRGMKDYDSDLTFGLQRLIGVNHSIIRLCKKIPKKLGVTKKMLIPSLEKLSLEDALSSNRIFITDYVLMKDLPTRSKDYVVCAPIGLFFKKKNGDLLPIAIQLYQDKANDNPVFLPSDPEYTWLMAKMWFNNADSGYHQAITHLGFTHLIMEGVAAITNANLSQSHPIFKLLSPHFLYLMAINRLALDKLLGPGGWVSKTMNAGVAGVLELVRRAFSDWKLNVQGTLPEDLKERGMLTEDGSVFRKKNYFLEDALLLYNVIKIYVTKYVMLYYDLEKLAGDWERDALSGPISEKKLGLKGVPGENGKFQTLDDLIITLTCIVYTCSVGHAAANFQQYDMYGYPPAYPAYMAGRPPTNKDPLKETDIMNALPDKPTTLDIMLITQILSTKGTRSLGDFEVQQIVDPAAIKIVEEFKEKLKAAGQLIKERNNDRKQPYDYLAPENIPNAISI